MPLVQFAIFFTKLQLEATLGSVTTLVSIFTLKTGNIQWEEHPPVYQDSKAPDTRLCTEVTVMVLFYTLVSLCGQKQGNGEVFYPQDPELPPQMLHATGGRLA